MEIPTHPNEEPLIHIYLLYVVRTGGRGSSFGYERPAAIPFSSMEKVKQRVVEIALRSETIEERFKLALQLLKEQRNWNEAVQTVRQAQMGNNVPLGFDFWWEDEPHILQ